MLSMPGLAAFASAHRESQGTLLFFPQQCSTNGDWPVNIRTFTGTTVPGIAAFPGRARIGFLTGFRFPKLDVRSGTLVCGQ